MCEKSEIPVPTEKINLKKDLSAGRLNKWKNLFEEINQKIKVILFFEDNFRLELEKQFRDIKFPGSYYHQAKILVILPEGFNRDFLFGMSDDKMFSNIEMEKDLLIIGDEDSPCEPTVKKWQEFYFNLCAKENENRRKVPRFPDKRKILEKVS